jgi:hypothetical protein
METSEIPAENATAAPVSQTGMMSGEMFKPPAEPAPDPRAHQFALATALRIPKPATTEEGS